MGSLAPRGMSVMEMYRLYRNNQLIVNRKYQRKLVWTLDEKKALIESILKEYPIPLILLAEIGETFEIVDGIQRLNAIFGYIENQFYVNDSEKEIFFNTKLFPLASVLAAKKIFIPIYGDDINYLDDNKTASFLEYQLPITKYHAEKENDVIETFRRINSYGKHLSPQEVRQAGVTTKFTELVKELGSELRGDVSKEIVSLTDMPEISIDARRMKLGYGISAEDTFWCKQGILNPSQLRDSEDEQFIADIVLSIALDKPFPASKEEFDRYYGKGVPDKSHEIETALNKYGVENIKKDIKIVISKIKEISETNLKETKLKNILSPKSGANPAKEPFYTFFMSTYTLMIKEVKEPFDIDKIFDAISDLASKTKGASHYVTSSDRKKNIDLCKGLIQDYYKRVDTIERSSGTLSIDFENYLRRSIVEAPMYDFKQGFYSLNESNRSFSEEMLEKIYQNMAALANLGKGKKGYIIIGVTDKEEDTAKIEKIDKLINVPRFGNFGVVGLEREAKLKKVSFDEYISSITQNIRKSELPDWLKSKINTSVTPITYKGFTVLMIEVISGNEPIWYKNKLFIRDGASCKELKGNEINSAYTLFK
jgi:uncharacterized protein with ParB-like and HNH nuclease domain